MDTPEHIVAQALSSFNSQLSDRQIVRFKTITLQHVQVQVITIQRDQEKAKAMMNFSRFRLFVEAFKQFEDVSKALDVGISDLSGYIWGPTHSILESAKEDPKALDCILESYCKFGQHLPLIAAYKSQLQEKPETKICLAWMYSDLLQFNASMLKLFQIRSWRKTFAANWKDYDKPFESLLCAFKSHGSFLKRSSNNEQHQRIHNMHQRLNDHILQYQQDRSHSRRQARDAEIDRKNRQYLDIIKWLDSPGTNEPEKQYQDEFLNVRSDYPDTGRWILDEDIIRDWMGSEIPNNSFIWIRGKKGAGKTILASLIINHLTEEREESNMSYFYCREKDESLGELPFLAIMKSLLRQLVCQNRDLLPTFHEKRMKQQEMLKDESTARTLLELFCELNVRQFIVIDGLDEISDIHVKSVVEFLDSIVRRSNEYHPGKIRVLLLSTDLPILRRLTESDRVGDLAINTDSTLKDIKSYVAKQADRLKEQFPLSDHDLKLAQSLTCNKSDGMFLYAFLVMDNLLKQPNAQCVMKELIESNFPVGLNEAYSKIITRLRDTLSKNTWLVSRKIFGLLAYAKRPLKWHELQAALSIDIDEQGNIQVQNDATRLCQDIRDICGSLVHVVDGNSIEFVHQTAKEFVMNKENLNGITLECDLTLLCLRYLSHNCFQSKLDPEHRKQWAKDGYYAFQDYAISNWESHLKSMIKKSPGLFQSQETRQEYGLKASNTLRAFCSAYENSLDHVNPGQEQQAPSFEEEAKLNCEPFANQEFHGHLLKIWTHVVKHDKQPFKERNKVSLKDLREALEESRVTIERLAAEPEDSSLAESLRSFYGDNFYKCTGITCAYFYEGLARKEDLEKHLNRHDRPFPCTIPNCSVVPFGFSSNKDLDKHLHTYHPDMSDQPSVFVQLDRRVTAEAKFQCRLCHRSYTRQANLDAHMNSAHLGRRPYACGICGREFARKNDRTRHGKLHVRRVR